MYLIFDKIKSSNSPKQMFQQPSTTACQKVQKVQVEDIQISNDESTTAIKVQKAKRFKRFKWKIFKLVMMEVQRL